MKTVWIYKMAACHSKTLCFFVHHLNKGIHAAAAYCSGNCHCSIIRGIHKKRMKKLIHGNLISGSQSTYLRICLQRHILGCNGNRLFHICMFHSYQSSHDFCDTGRIRFFIERFGEQQLFILNIKKCCSFIPLCFYSIHRGIPCTHT